MEALTPDATLESSLAAASCEGIMVMAAVPLTDTRLLLTQQVDRMHTMVQWMRNMCHVGGRAWGRQ